MKGHNITLGTFSIILIIAGPFGIMTIPFAYSQTSSFDVQNIPAKKVNVGDINIAYKLFGKGDPFLLISGSGLPKPKLEYSVLEANLFAKPKKLPR